MSVSKAVVIIIVIYSYHYDYHCKYHHYCISERRKGLQSLYFFGFQCFGGGFGLRVPMLGEEKILDNVGSGFRVQESRVML